MTMFLAASIRYVYEGRAKEIAYFRANARLAGRARPVRDGRSFVIVRRY
jgi:hypothetical protein